MLNNKLWKYGGIPLAIILCCFLLFQDSRVPHKNEEDLMLRDLAAGQVRLLESVHALADEHKQIFNEIRAIDDRQQQLQEVQQRQQRVVSNVPVSMKARENIQTPPPPQAPSPPPPQSSTYTSKLLRINSEQQGPVAVSINEFTYLENVAVDKNNIYLYNLAEADKQALGILSGKLPPYKRFVGIEPGEVLRDLPQPNIVFREGDLQPSSCAGGVVRDEIAYFSSRWHTDNMYHLHNDNILPLVANILSTPGCETNLTCDLPTVHYELEADPEKLVKEVKAAKILNMIFTKTKSYKDMFVDGAPTCVRRLSWGRGPHMTYFKFSKYFNGRTHGYGRRPIFTNGGERAKTFWLQRSKMVISALNLRVRQELGLPIQREHAFSGGVGKFKLLYIERSHGDRMFPPGTTDILLDVCKQKNIVCEICCNWKQDSLQDILRKIGDADVLLGVHGAGLSHIYYAKVGAMLIDFYAFPPGEWQWRDMFDLMVGTNQGQVSWQKVTYDRVGRSDFENVVNNVLLPKLT
eukprot:m.32612 g.32612  ORF g.32612 m.32612 type:complete len:520 (+) comp8431_c1_seq1:82-1641(+)